MAAERTIVVVDEDRENRSLVELAVAGPDRAVVGFCDARSAFEFIEAARHVDVVVSDAAIAGSDGRDLMRRLQANPKTAAARVIVVSTEDGGTDQIRKPFEIDELRRRVDAAIAQRASRDVASEGVAGLATRQRFEHAVAEAQTAAAQKGSAVAVMVAAVQDFDALVARFGRDEAECVLERIASIVIGRLRAGDSAARIARDSLGSLHPSCNARGAESIGHRLYEALADDQRCLGAGFALGIAVETKPASADAGRIISAAERAAVEAKSAGEGRRIRLLID